jgi:NADPH-dependent 2,4-dienoyl-CoA reductase/sulfur reductase-like enzyme
VAYLRKSAALCGGFLPTFLPQVGKGVGIRGSNAAATPYQMSRARAQGYKRHNHADRRRPEPHDTASPFPPRLCGRSVACGRRRYGGGGSLLQLDGSARIVIVGAGVAGLEAARVAAMCGHRVTLIEREFEVRARC